ILEGRFREDLFYRLNVISITLPPLRDRADDMIELALYFLNRAAERAGKRITHLDEPVLDALRRHPWPGNIRELENAVERAVVMADGPVIRLNDLPETIVASTRQVRIIETKPARLESPAAAEMQVLLNSTAASPPAAPDINPERQALADALQRTGGNKAEAARLLGIPRSTLFSRLKKYGFEK
ncbi:MAG: sigma-54-dependent Fis family transcriptional regulator, partial [Planctomycetes bacterium]|nr:sigma-54-dependent Fis family transcriptional regulator [Planctomycetota bacterium]